MTATLAREIAYESCMEEVNKVVDIVKQAAANKKLEADIDFQLSDPTVKYLTFKLGYEVRGCNTSFFFDRGKKYFYTINW